MPTRPSNLGYVAARRESTKGTPAGAPNVFLKAYSESLSVIEEKISDNPLSGNNFMRQQVIPNYRSYMGELQVQANVATALYLFDMLMVHTGTAGSGTYTHTFQFMNGLTALNPKSYTLDISYGNVVERFAGVELRELAAEYDEAKLLYNLQVTALNAFQVCEIDDVAAAVVTLKTNVYDDPTALLVAGDLVRLYDVSAGTSQDFTIDSIDGLEVTLSGSPSGIADGDLFYLRPQAVTLVDPSPLLWPRTQYFFGTDVADALGNDQTRIDEGSYTLSYALQTDEGERRSGSYAIAELVRTLADASATIRRFFDDPQELHQFLTNATRTMVIRHLSADNTAHYIEIEFHKTRLNNYPTELNSGDPIYSENEILAEFDEVVGHAITVKVVNAVASL